MNWVRAWERDGKEGRSGGWVRETGRERGQGSGEGEFKVHQVGWSFGGQFSDFNNDGKLDLYVPSGYYTAPTEIATEVDT